VIFLKATSAVVKEDPKRLVPILRGFQKQLEIYEEICEKLSVPMAFGNLFIWA
jgi:hypothetical protein